MRWIVLALCISPIWGSLAWHLYASRVRPLFVPEEEIRQRLTQVLLTRDPHFAVMAEEYAAWVRGDTVDQGIWRRVRRALVRRGG